LNKDAGLARKSAAEAIERAADADLRRVELENRIVDSFGPRQLTDDQSARIAKRLLGLAGARIDVLVLAAGNPFNETESKESIEFTRAITSTLSSARMDAEGWLVRCTNAFGASNVVVNVHGTDAKDLLEGSQVMMAIAPEIATYPYIQDGVSGYSQDSDFSDVDKSKPNRGKHDAAVSIIVGRKINSVLTREMLEPAEQKKR